MTLRRLRKFFLYCTIINYVLLIVWFVIYKLPHEWAYNLSTPPFALEPSLGASVATVSLPVFDGYMLLGIIVYKVLVIFFCLVPCIVLHLIPERVNSEE